MAIKFNIERRDSDTRHLGPKSPTIDSRIAAITGAPEETVEALRDLNMSESFRTFRVALERLFIEGDWHILDSIGREAQRIQAEKIAATEATREDLADGLVRQSIIPGPRTSITPPSDEDSEMAALNAILRTGSVPPAARTPKDGKKRRPISEAPAVQWAIKRASMSPEERRRTSISPSQGPTSPSRVSRVPLAGAAGSSDVPEKGAVRYSIPPGAARKIRG